MVRILLPNCQYANFTDEEFKIYNQIQSQVNTKMTTNQIKTLIYNEKGRLYQIAQKSMLEKQKAEHQAKHLKAVQAKKDRQNEADKKALSVQIQQLGQANTNLQQSLSNKSDSISQLVQSNSVLQSTLNQQNSSINQLQNANQTLSNQLVQTERSVEQLRQEETQHRNHIQQLEKTIASLTTQLEAIPSLQKTIDLLFTQLEEQQKQLTEILSHLL